MTLYNQSLAAEDDWREMVKYTANNHGEAQVTIYTRKLLTCMDTMANGQGVHKDLKIAHHKIRIKHCQKHYIVGVLKKSAPLLIIGIFYERMDLIRHVKKRIT